MGIKTKFNPMGGTSDENKGVLAVYPSSSTTCILMKNGDLFICGRNDFGQQGSGNTTDVSIFTKRASNVIDVACYENYTYYVGNNNDLYGCGIARMMDGYGQSSTSAITSFYKQKSNIIRVWTGVFYQESDLDIYGKGYNNYGQQGSGNTNFISSFTYRKNAFFGFANSENGNATWIIDFNGDLYGCGANDCGQQGSGNTTYVTTFTKRAGFVKKIACSSQTTAYINSSKDLYIAGYYPNNNTFQKCAENVKSVSCGGGSNWYITESGDLYGCGVSSYVNSGINSGSFTKLATNVKIVKTANRTCWYITESGDLYGCGYNNYGQQGSGNTTNVLSFTKRASNVVDVFPGDFTTWYIDTNGNVYGCGVNDSYQQGNGSSSTRKTFENKMQYLQ